MADEYSEYELKRKRQIAENQAVLAAMGIEPLNSKPSKTQKKEKREHRDYGSVPSRASARLSSKFTKEPIRFIKLTDNFFKAEERAAVRPKRNKMITTPIDLPSHRQAAPPQPSQPPQPPPQQPQPQSFLSPPLMTTVVSRGGNVAAPIPGNTKDHGYFVEGNLGVCDKCFKQFVLKKNGVMRKHKCFSEFPGAEFDPSALIAPTAPTGFSSINSAGLPAPLIQTQPPDGPSSAEPPPSSAGPPPPSAAGPPEFSSASSINSAGLPLIQPIGPPAGPPDFDLDAWFN